MNMFTCKGCRKTLEMFDSADGDFCHICFKTPRIRSVAHPKEDVTLLSAGANSVGEARYCKGCLDRTRNMHCHCGDQHLTKSMTYSEAEVFAMEAEVFAMDTAEVFAMDTTEVFAMESVAAKSDAFVADAEILPWGSMA